MTIVIAGKMSKKTLESIVRRIKAEKDSSGLRSHFGKLKRNVNALDYQKTVRNEWD